jgi:hypothetical protein
VHQAAWFALYTLARKVGDAGPGRERWECGGRQFLGVTGAWGLGAEWTAIYDAPRHGDQILLDRQRAGFDPAGSTLAEQLQRLVITHRLRTMSGEIAGALLVVSRVRRRAWPV